MGKLTPQPEPAIQHFSHPHPLQLSNYQPQQTLSLASCSGCKLKLSRWIYTCTNCTYFLHISCSQLPQKITHPFDHNHVLSLLCTPFYPEGLFNCDACGKQGNGFSYHCGICNIDLHTKCATMPLLLTHQSHHHHQLNLNFSIPYPNKNFCCDICKNLGSKQWLYRCNLCEFDAHLDCAITESKPAPVQAPIQQVQAPIPQNQVQYYQRAPTPAITQYQAVGTPLATRSPAQSFVPTNNFVRNAAAPSSLLGSNMLMPIGTLNRQGNPLLNQVVQNLVTGSSQNLVQGLIGSGGGIDLGNILGGGGIDLGGLGGLDFGGLGGF